MINFHGIKISWLGQSCFRIENQITVYLDPFEIKKEDTADLILITHDHYDHCNPEDIDKLLGEETIIIAPSSCDPKLARDFKKVKPGEKIELKGIKIETVPAYNTNKKAHPREKNYVGYIIEIDKKRIYHAADTDSIPEMSKIKADIIMLPVGGTFTMNAEEAAEVANKINPKIAIPMHYGSVVGSRQDAEKFKQLCKCKVEILGREE